MYYVGLKIKYQINPFEGEPEIKTSEVEAWCFHSTFDEIFLSNGDHIVDEQIIEVIE